MVFVIKFPYQFFDLQKLAAYRGLPHATEARKDCVVPLVALTDEISRNMVSHFEDVNDELKCSGSITDCVYCLEGFNLISVQLKSEIQTIELTFEGEGDRELFNEYLSLEECFGGGEFLVTEDILILFHANQYTDW